MDIFAYNTMGSATDDETARVRELVTANPDAARQAVQAITKNPRAFDGVDAKGADATYELQQDIDYKEQAPRTLAQIRQDIKEQGERDLTTAEARSQKESKARQRTRCPCPFRRRDSNCREYRAPCGRSDGGV